METDGKIPVQDLGPALVIRPGDTLIVAVRDRISMAEADAIRGKLKAWLPDLADVVLVPAVGLAAYRPSGQEEER